MAARRARPRSIASISNTASNATSLITGTWVDVDALDFVAPTTHRAMGALDGRHTANRTSRPRRHQWTQHPARGDLPDSLDGLQRERRRRRLAVDDFTVTPHGGGGPTLSINDVSVTEGNSGTMTATSP